MITPQQDYLLVKRDPKADTTDGGIALPDDAQKRTQRGTVLKVGPGIRSEKTGQRIHMECKVGDRVLFGGLSGVTLDVGMGEDVFMIKEGHLEGVIDE